MVDYIYYPPNAAETAVMNVTEGAVHDKHMCSLNVYDDILGEYCRAYTTLNCSATSKYMS